MYFFWGGVILLRKFSGKSSGKYYGSLFWEICGGGIFHGDMCGREYVDVRILVQDYMSLRPAIMIWATLEHTIGVEVPYA